MHSLHRLLSAALFFLAMLSPTAHAQFSHWTETNPFSSWTVASIAIGRNGEIMVGRERTGLVFSQNNGESWQTTFDPHVVFHVPLRSIAIRSDGTFYVGGYSGTIHRSINGGRNWYSTFLIEENRAPVGEFSFNSRGDAFVGSGGEYFRSIDNGKNWSKLAGTAGRVYGSQVLVDPQDRLYIAGPGGVARSSDNGSSWQQLYGGGEGIDIVSFRRNSRGVLFGATAAKGVYRSDDDGASWAPASNGLPSRAVRELKIASNDVLFTIVDSSASGEFGGLFRSTNDGGSWHRFDEGLVYQRGVTMALDSNGGVIYAVVIEEEMTGRVFRTDAAGATWSTINNGPPTLLIGPVVVDSTGIVYAGLRGMYVTRSTDKGRTWSPTPVSFDGDILSMVVTPAGSILAGTSKKGILRSSDQGLTFTTSNTGLADTAIERLVINGRGTIYAGGPAEADWYASRDDGRTWLKETIGFIDSTTVRLLPDGRQLALGGGVPHISSDGGVTWTEVADPLFSFNAGLTFSRLWTGADGMVIGYSGAAGGALARSSDMGATWTRVLDEPITMFDVNRVGVMFAGGESGIFRSDDRGLTWRSITDDLPYYFRPRSIALDPDGFLYLSMMSGNGILRSKGSTTSGVEPAAPAHDRSAVLASLYPNPTHHGATLKLELRQSAQVQVTIEDMLGRNVLTVRRAYLAEGIHDIDLELEGNRGASIPPGNYLVIIAAGGERFAKRLVVLD